MCEVRVPKGGLPVISHRHPGSEHFRVKTGVLDLVVDGVLRRLDEDEGFTVHQEFPPPGYTSDDTVVIVKCEPGDFAERDSGMRHR